MTEPSELEKIRLEKLAQLENEGVRPFPRRSERTHTSEEAIAAFEIDEEAEISVIVAGRIRSLREMGKSSFSHLEDGQGRLQLYLRLDEMGDETFSRFHQTVDIGDFVQAEGLLFRTKTGEVSLRVNSYRMLAKSLLPLPTPKKEIVAGEEVVHDAFSDPEARYRERYVDLAVNPEVRQIFHVRARMIQALRTFLDARDFLEVETPVLQPIYGGAAAKPFVTHHNQLHQDLYLRISFELYLKRLLVGGIERVYEIGKDFRNEGVDRTHNPEFTQLEFYMAYADYHAVMALTEEMLSFAAEQAVGTTKIEFDGHQIDLTPPWRRMTLFEAAQQFADLDLEKLGEVEPLRKAMQKKGIDPGNDDTWGKLADRVLSTAVEARLIEPTFIYDFPRDVSPFAKAKPDQPTIVERFEGFAGGIELCNAFTELNDPRDQQARFVEASETFQAGEDERHPMDEDYLNAMRYGMPPNGGFGMGIDRFAMLLTGVTNIREVILFPHLRDRNTDQD